MNSDSSPTLKRPSLLIMLLDAMAMIVFLGLGIAGFMMSATPMHPHIPFDNRLLGVFGGVAMLLAVWFFIRLKRANRRFLDVSRQQILADPNSILLSWTVDDHQYVIAKQGLIIDQAYYGFDEVYEQLKSVRWLDDETMQFDISVKGGKYPITKTLNLPIPDSIKQQAQVMHEQFFRIV